jgi:hypothetical protein
MLSHSTVSTIELLVPLVDDRPSSSSSSNASTSSNSTTTMTTNETSYVIHLMVIIRDRFDAIEQVNLSSILVSYDQQQADEFLTDLLRLDSPSSSSLLSPAASSTNPNQTSFHRIINSGNQNLVNQLVLSFVQYFNLNNQQLLQQSVASTCLFLGLVPDVDSHA